MRLCEGFRDENSVDFCVSRILAKKRLLSISDMIYLGINCSSILHQLEPSCKVVRDLSHGMAMGVLQALL